MLHNTACLVHTENIKPQANIMLTCSRLQVHPEFEQEAGTPAPAVQITSHVGWVGQSMVMIELMIATGSF